MPSVAPHALLRAPKRAKKFNVRKPVRSRAGSRGCLFRGAVRMKASVFDYTRPATLADAVAVLGEAIAAGKTVQLLAGGQSLLAMMSLRLSAPQLVVDISRLEELRGAKVEDDAILYRACVTHAAIEDGRFPDPSSGLMPKVAANLAYRAVRIRGTIGGSLALSDPAADWVTVMPALDAQIALFGPGGRRTVNAAEFTTGIYETARKPDEILEGVKIRKLSPAGRWGLSKFCHKTGEFATSLAAAVVDPARDYARIVLGGLEGPPIVLALASKGLKEGARLDDIRKAARADLQDSGHQLDAYLHGVHEAMISRAVSQVLK